MKEQKPKKFSIKMQKKLLCLYALIILAFILLSVRLSWIVKADGATYEKQVLSQQKYDSVTLPFRRGDIVDTKGTKLAVSEKVYNLVIDSYVMLSRETYLEPTMEALSANFPDLDMTAVFRRQHWRTARSRASGSRKNTRESIPMVPWRRT